MAAYARMARDAGARIIGGCCGTTALHLQAMVEALETAPRAPAPSYDEIERALGPIRKITTREPRSTGRRGVARA